MGRTDDRGTYRISSYFDTFSGRNIFMGDRCNGAPKTVTVVVSAHGYEARRVTVTLHKVACGRVEGDIGLSFQLLSCLGVRGGTVN
jgi:hypothetical protein